jgi:hypothetical protein
MYSHTLLYGPIVKWRYCRPHLTSSFVRHVGIIDCGKLKSKIRWHSAAPNIIQIRPGFIEFNLADRQTDAASPICVDFMHIVHRKESNDYFLKQHQTVDICNGEVLCSL